MFCSECGTAAEGKFCFKCGTRLATAQAGQLVPSERDEDVIPMAEVVPVNWTLETNYRRLLQHDEVRERIAMAGQHYREQLSGEEVLALFDAISPTGVPLEKLCRLIAPLYDKMGIRTGKQARVAFALPPGRILLGVLCALAGAGQKIKSVEQATDGCVLHATIPSNIWSLAGELMVSIHAENRQTVVEAATKIPGQLYDWGKSQRLLDQLMLQSRAFAA
jgi:hypothetical protein